MKNNHTLLQEAEKMLMETSRTFVIPITRLEGALYEVVMATYLCMRSIDEIEDHPQLENVEKSKLLHRISNEIVNMERSLSPLFTAYYHQLPEVTVRMDDWLSLIPHDIAPKVRTYIAKMATGMATWAKRNWMVKTEADLNDYTYVVAGLVGELLSLLWKWHEGIETSTELAISFGRGLQAVNIIRNRNEDQKRGVSFYPDGWTEENMLEYAKMQLNSGKNYIATIPSKHIYEFCSIPLALAFGTLQAIENNQEKLTRKEVLQIVEDIIL